MTNQFFNVFAPRRLALLATLVLSLAASGCVYRLAIQQGNIADTEAVEQVEVGMTPSQVRFLLGSPLVDDPFDAQRWDYIFYRRIGREEALIKHFMTVRFTDGKVSSIETKDEPPQK